MNLLDRITINPNISHGKPCIRGMRWPVEVILDMISSEIPMEDILKDHPELEKDDLLASLQYAKIIAAGKTLKEVA